MAHLPAIQQLNLAVLTDKYVSGMRVGVEKPVDEYLLEKPGRQPAGDSFQIDIGSRLKAKSVILVPCISSRVRILRVVRFQ